MTDEQYMQLALQEAKKAFDEDEVPIGAIVVLNNKIIAKGYNQVEKLCDSTAHAEILALTTAYSFLGSKYLPEATLYVTIEPCLMCCGALYWSKIGRIVYGAEDEKNGYKKFLPPLSQGRGAGGEEVFHPKTNITSGVLKNECTQLMKDFFALKRNL